MTEAVNGYERRTHPPRRIAQRAGALILASIISVLGAVNYDKAEPYFSQARDMWDWGWQGLKDIRLPDIAPPSAEYSDATEEFIYDQVAKASTPGHDIKLPMIQDIYAISNADILAGNPNPLTLGNPLVINAPNGTQYLVAHNSKVTDSTRNLLYLPIQEVQFCSANGSNPIVVNRDIEVDPSTRSFKDPKLAFVVHQFEQLGDACQRTVPTQEIIDNSHRYYQTALPVA